MRVPVVPLKYLTPLAFLALLPLDGWFGGAWTITAAAATPLCLASLDAGSVMKSDPMAQAADDHALAASNLRSPAAGSDGLVRGVGDAVRNQLT